MHMSDFVLQISVIMREFRRRKFILQEEVARWKVCENKTRKRRKRIERKHNSFMAAVKDKWVIFRMIISTPYPKIQGCCNFMRSGELSVLFRTRLYMQVICNRTLKSQ